jgi:hypothetical protein
MSAARSWLTDRGHGLIDQWAQILAAESRGEPGEGGAAA